MINNKNTLGSPQIIKNLLHLDQHLSLLVSSIKKNSMWWKSKGWNPDLMSHYHQTIESKMWQSLLQLLMVMGNENVNDCWLFLFCFLKIMGCIVFIFQQCSLCMLFFIWVNFVWCGCGCVIFCFITLTSSLRLNVECKGSSSQKNLFKCETFLLIGESAKDGVQRFLNALSFWELHSCENLDCLKPWLKRQTNIKLSLQDTTGKVLKCRGLKCHCIVHWNLKWVMIKRRIDKQIGNLTPDHKSL